MTEQYSGVKFRTIFEEKLVPLHNVEAEELIEWCRLFAKKGLSTRIGKGFSGNLSFRTKKGFVITGTAVSFSRIRKEELVEVIECNEEKKEAVVIGLVEPSSESFMHYMIYEEKPEINAVFHLHDEKVVEKTKKIGLPITREVPYGTIERAKEVLRALKGTKFAVIKNEGIVALGKNMQEAGQLVLETHDLAEEI